jgi:hypothetical protein
MGNLKYVIHGADRETAEDVTLRIVATNQAEAEQVAASRGILISSVDCDDVAAVDAGEKSDSNSGLLAVGGFLLLILVCAGLLNSPDARTNRNESSVSPLRDPRDARFDSPAGRQVIKAFAEEATVSEEEMMRAINEEIDRRGLSDWSNGDKV